MIRTATLDRNQKPTEEQIQQIREAANKEIIFDEDSPSLHQLWKKRFAWRRKTVTDR